MKNYPAWKELNASDSYLYRNLRKIMRISESCRYVENKIFAELNHMISNAHVINTTLFKCLFE